MSENTWGKKVQNKKRRGKKPRGGKGGKGKNGELVYYRVLLTLDQYITGFVMVLILMAVFRRGSRRSPGVSIVTGSRFTNRCAHVISGLTLFAALKLPNLFLYLGLGLANLLFDYAVLGLGEFPRPVVLLEIKPVSIISMVMGSDD